MLDETLLIDPKLDYETVTGLSNEVRERLKRVRPASIVRSSIRVNPSSVSLTSFTIF